MRALQIPEGGRSRVGTLAKQSERFCGSGVPELPDKWKAPERETPIEKKRPKLKRAIDELTSTQEFTGDKRYCSGELQSSSMIKDLSF